MLYKLLIRPLLGGVFRLLFLAALAAGCYYLYLRVAQDAEMKADIQNTIDRYAVEFDMWLNGVEDEVRQGKEDVQDMRRKTGF